MQSNKILNQTPNYKSYTWNGIIEYMQDQVKQNMIKQNEWLLERQQFTSKISRLEAELKAQETINQDLVKRVKMLEFCLRKERMKYSSLLAGKNIDTSEWKELASSQASITHSAALAQLNYPAVPKRRAKGHRHLLLKFLEEIGYDDIFSKTENLESNPNNRTMINLDNPDANDTSAILVGCSDQDRSDNASISDFRIKKNSFDLRREDEEEKAIEVRIKTNEGKESARFREDHSTSKSERKDRHGWKEFATLRGHFDGVRDLFVYSNESILCSVSEDCMVKVWDLNQVKHKKEIPGHIDSYLTFREHTGPLFSIAGVQSDSKNSFQKNLLYTGGSEGIVRVWNIVSPKELADLNEDYSSKSFCVGHWVAHDEPIWEMQHHPYKSALLTISADGYVKLWETFNREGNSISGKLKAQFFTKIPEDTEPDYLVPTSASWIHTNLNQIVCGFGNSNALAIFDQETLSHIGSLKFGKEALQPNKVISHPMKPLIISAHEDGYIRFFDLNASTSKQAGSKPIQSILAHEDSVTSLSYNSVTGNLISVSHDGSMKVWDLRNYSCLQEIENIHLSKYDESAHCVLSEDNAQYIFTGGADGLIKLFDRM